MAVRKKRPDGNKAGGKGSKKAGYAVVGLGYFAQTAVLPAFAHAKQARLAALVSDDPVKLKKLAAKYGVEKTFSYQQYQECLADGEVDAVYIALPNDMHKEYTVRAAKMGVHVLVEKPMAVTEKDCEEMIREAREHNVRLMVAYRLHMDAANLQAIEIVKSGRLGEPRFMQSAFSMQVKEDNIRVQAAKGGGSVYDLGIYCINAARYLFQEEPYEVFAYCATSGDPRFREVDEMTGALLRFPGERLASFTSSFGAADAAHYQVLGTKGELRVENAFEYAVPIKHIVTLGGRRREKEFPKRDQVAAELDYFADCVLQGREPEPSGLEGLADVRIIRAIYESAQSGKPVKLERIEKRTRPSAAQEITRPAAEKPEHLVHAEQPARDS